MLVDARYRNDDGGSDGDDVDGGCDGSGDGDGGRCWRCQSYGKSDGGEAGCVAILVIWR